MGNVPEEKQQSLVFGSDDRGSRERLRELMLFIADRSRNDSKFGAVKLNKILYYSDLLYFAHYEEPITGTTYTKLQAGPTPTSVKAVQEDMIRDGEIVISEEGLPPRLRRRIIPKRKANLESFSGVEIATVDKVIDSLFDYNAAETSELSHDRAWESAEYNELIPYEASLLSDSPLTERDIDRAQELSEQYGWSR